MKTVLLLLSFFMVFGGRAGASSLVDHCRKILADRFPRIQAEHVTTSPEPHFCEIQTGGNILYLNPEQGFFLFGDLVDFDGRNLTAEARQRIVAEKIASLPLKNALTFGKGKDEVIIFVDPDCPACRRLEKFLLGPDILETISLHVFLFPLEKIHPAARQHCLEILCSKNPRAKILEFADDRVKGNENHDLSSACLKEAGERLDAMIDAGSSINVRGTPTVIINNRILGGNILQISRELLRLAGAESTSNAPASAE